MGGALRKLTGPLKEFGLLAGLIYGIDRVFIVARSSIRLYFYDLMVQPVADQPFVPPNLGKMIDVREIKRGDPVLAFMPVPPEILERRFNQSTMCLGAFQSGRFVAYQWLCFGHYDEDEVRCTFAPQPANRSVWDFDVYVFPEDRLGLGFARLWDETNRRLRDRGIAFSFSRVSRYNVTSRKVHAYFKWRRLGRAIFLTGKRLQVMVATVSPYLHLSLHESAKPRIQLRPEGRDGTRASGATNDH